MSAAAREMRVVDVQRGARQAARGRLWGLVVCAVALWLGGCEATDAAPHDAAEVTQAPVGLRLAPPSATPAAVDTLTHWAALELGEALRAHGPTVGISQTGDSLRVCVGCEAQTLRALNTLEGTASIIGQCGAGAPATFIAGQFSQAFPIHSVSGDHALLFAVQQSPGLQQTLPNVRVMRRLDGHVLGTLPPPPEGWGVPLTALVRSFERDGLLSTRGELLITDVRVTPDVALAAPQPAKLYRYQYSYTLWGGFQARLLESAPLPVNTTPPGAGLPNGFIYLASVTTLPSGDLLATDLFAGSIWTAPSLHGPWHLTLIDPRLGPAPISNIQGIKRSQTGGLEPYTVSLPSPPGAPFVIGPGLESITYAHLTDEACFASNAQGGLYCVPRTTLLDTSTPPFLKGDSLRTVVPPSPGLNDLTDGVTYDRFHPSSPWLYWHRAPSDQTPFDGSGFNTLRRVHLLSGHVEVIAKTNTCFDWTYEISPLPPLLPSSPFTSIASSVGQGPNDPAFNTLLLGQLAYVAPSLLPITVTTSW